LPAEREVGALPFKILPQVLSKKPFLATNDFLFSRAGLPMQHGFAWKGGIKLFNILKIIFII
jgi:hypothetical protein